MPDSVLLVLPATWHIWVKRVHAIDPGRTGLQSMRNLNSARDVPREHRGSKAASGVTSLRVRSQSVSSARSLAL